MHESHTHTHTHTHTQLHKYTNNNYKAVLHLVEALRQQFIERFDSEKLVSRQFFNTLAETTISRKFQDIANGIELALKQSTVNEAITPFWNIQKSLATKLCLYFLTVVFFLHTPRITHTHTHTHTHTTHMYALHLHTHKHTNNSHMHSNIT